MNFKKVALISIAINILAFSIFAAKRYYFAHSAPAPVAKNQFDVYDQARCSLFNELSIDSSDIVFVGTSLTEQFPLEEMFHSLHFKNRGISGNESRHILHRIRSIADCHPKKIFLDIGINDIIFHRSFDSLVYNYDEIIKTIRTRSPQTEIYVQSVLPVGISRASAEPLIEKFNAALKKSCAGWKVPFIDLFPFYYKASLLDTTMSLDDLHLLGKGYAVWKEKLLPYLTPYPADHFQQDHSGKN